MAVGKDTHVSENQPDSDGETAAARRLAEALDPSAIDALLADAKAAGTPIDGVDGLLNQMTKAVLERSLQTEMTRPEPARLGAGESAEPAGGAGRDGGGSEPGQPKCAPSADRGRVHGSWSRRRWYSVSSISPRA